MVELVLAAIFAPLALAAMIVMASFALARVWGWGAVAAEVAATVWSFFVLIPFTSRRMPLDAPAGASGPPVLLVHGYLCNHGVFLSLARRLVREGYAVHLHDLRPAHARIDDYVPALAARIDAILARSGHAQLAVACHSMGGLALRAYLREHGPGRIAALITIGTPHHGTRLGNWAASANARQMAAGSAWLQALAAAPRDGLPIVAIWSTHDNIVTPQESATLPGAENIRVDGIGHLSMLLAREVIDAVVQALRRHLPL